ncbi:MAG: rod shape-determining protein MreD [Calditrichaeota bacterium]|nr:MAG: rod shape-determining protein MreD [Calditrichota bacterium]MBL1206566.1 rod shape-determining protein MreD [Calditrichota bacterium]NOG46393.1 rod shape-determining protein MreD [Calditrichota bacterium]
MNQELKYFLFIIITFGIGSVLVQGIAVPYIEIAGGWKPDLVLIIVLLIGKRFGSVAGSTSGFILGLIQDSLTAMPIGITALPKVMAGYASGKMTTLKFEGSVNFLWFIAFIFLHEFIFYFILQFKTDLTFTYLIYSRIFPNTIYSTVMMGITYFLTQKYFAEIQ